MDYSSAADVPIGKSFDNLIENDDRGNFMVKAAGGCFNSCVTKITESPLNQNEVDCLKNCYARNYLVHDSTQRNLSL